MWAPGEGSWLLYGRTQITLLEGTVMLLFCQEIVVVM
jgi:hypothetical protein